MSEPAIKIESELTDEQLLAIKRSIHFHEVKMKFSKEIMMLVVDELAEELGLSDMDIVEKLQLYETTNEEMDAEYNQ